MLFICVALWLIIQFPKFKFVSFCSKHLYFFHISNFRTEYFPCLAIIPPADLAVVAAPRQQVAVLGVKLARDEVVGGIQAQQRLRGVLCNIPE